MGARRIGRHLIAECKGTCERNLDNLVKVFGLERTVPKFLSLGPYEYQNYCNEVWKAIDCEDTAQARKLWDPLSGFFTYDWQVRWIERQCSLMVDYIEDHSKGQVTIEIINYAGDKGEIQR
jgi:hypothetical protein